LEEAKKILQNAIVAGIINDCGSGNSMNFCNITKGKLQMDLDYEIPPGCFKNKV